MSRRDPRGWNLLTQAEAARELGVTRARVYQLVEAGQLAHQVVGSRRYVVGASLWLYIVAHEAEQRTLAGKE